MEAIILLSPSTSSPVCPGERSLIDYLVADNSLVNPRRCSAHGLGSPSVPLEDTARGLLPAPAAPAVSAEAFLASPPWISFPRASPTLTIQAVHGACLLGLFHSTFPGCFRAPGLWWGAEKRKTLSCRQQLRVCEGLGLAVQFQGELGRGGGGWRRLNPGFPGRAPESWQRNRTPSTFSARSVNHLNPGPKTKKPVLSVFTPPTASS